MNLMVNDPIEQISSKREMRFSVTEREANARVDETLAARCGWLSRMHIARLVGSGACLVNDVLAPAGQKLRTDDDVRFTHDENDISNAMTPEALPLEIICEDEHLLVVVKAAGMLMHPTRNVKSGTLANALTYHLNRQAIEKVETDVAVDSALAMPADAGLQESITVRPGLVHRLDCATSGLVVVAKTQQALSVLSRHFHERRVEKKYLAVLVGQVASDEMTISAAIGRDAEAQPKWNVMEDGRAAETHLRVLESRAERTLVEFTPLTGRTNQLRIHSRHIGHPIIGDEWYGETPAERLCLHAANLGFHHPAGGGWLEFESPMPAAMRREWEKI